MKKAEGSTVGDLQYLVESQGLHSYLYLQGGHVQIREDTFQWLIGAELFQQEISELGILNFIENDILCQISPAHLPAVDDKVNRAIDYNQQVTEGDHDVHLVVPHLARVLPGHHRPELEHVDDELEAVAEDEHADDDQKDRPHHDLSLLTFGQSVQPFVPSSEMINSVFCSTVLLYTLI